MPSSPVPPTVAFPRTGGHPTVHPGAGSSSSLAVPSGRSKAQRWVESSPASSPRQPRPSHSGAPSYRDVLAPPVTSVKPTLVELQPSAARSWETALPSLSRALPETGGWQVYESRHRRRRRLRQPCPPCRPVLDDLKARCFNCLSSTHRAASCRAQPCCFRYLVSGHLLPVCPRK